MSTPEVNTNKTHMVELHWDLFIESIFLQAEWSIKWIWRPHPISLQLSKYQRGSAHYTKNNSLNCKQLKFKRVSAESPYLFIATILTRQNNKKAKSSSINQTISVKHLLNKTLCWHKVLASGAVNPVQKSIVKNWSQLIPCPTLLYFHVRCHSSPVPWFTREGNW